MWSKCGLTGKRVSITLLEKLCEQRAGEVGRENDRSLRRGTLYPAELRAENASPSGDMAIFAKCRIILMPGCNGKRSLLLI